MDELKHSQLVLKSVKPMMMVMVMVMVLTVAMVMVLMMVMGHTTASTSSNPTMKKSEAYRL